MKNDGEKATRRIVNIGIIIAFCMLSIVLGFIFGLHPVNFRELIIFLLFPTFIIIAGICTRSPICTVICAFLIVIFCGIGQDFSGSSFWDLLLRGDDFLGATISYSVIGAIFGAIGRMVRKEDENNCLRAYFYPLRACLYFIIISILFGFISGILFLHMGLFMFAAYPIFAIIFAIISGIYTKNPICGAICGYLCGFSFIFLLVPRWYPVSGACMWTIIYSIIGAVSGAIGNVMTKRSGTLKDLERGSLDIYTPVD